MSMHKALMLGLYGLGSAFSLRSLVVCDDNEPLGILELDESLDDVEKPEELPAGVYVGEVQDVQVQTSTKGNKYYAIKFVIPTEEIPNDVQESFPDGAVLYWNRQVVPSAKDRRALFNIKKLQQAFGLSTATNQIDPNEWMGCQARLRVKMGKWQGEDRAEIGAIEAAEASRGSGGGGSARGGRAARQEEDDEVTQPVRGSGGRGGAGSRGGRGGRK